MDKDQYSELFQMLDSVERRLANMQHDARLMRFHPVWVTSLLLAILWRVW